MTEALAVLLLSFVGIDGWVIQLNPIDVVLIREPLTTDRTKAAGCIIFTTDGQFIPVQESCKEVHRRIDGSMP